MPPGFLRYFIPVIFHETSGIARATSHEVVCNFFTSGCISTRLNCKAKKKMPLGSSFGPFNCAMGSDASLTAPSPQRTMMQNLTDEIAMHSSKVCPGVCFRPRFCSFIQQNSRTKGKAELCIVCIASCICCPGHF